jgi:hypothetical protein
VKEVFFFCVALVYQNQPHSFPTLAEIVDDIGAASILPSGNQKRFWRAIRSTVL